MEVKVIEIEMFDTQEQEFDAVVALTEFSAGSTCTCTCCGN